MFNKPLIKMEKMLKHVIKWVSVSYMLINILYNIILTATLGASLITRLKSGFNPSKEGITNKFNRFKADNEAISLLWSRFVCNVDASGSLSPIRKICWWNKCDDVTVETLEFTSVISQVDGKSQNRKKVGFEGHDDLNIQSSESNSRERFSFSP